MNACVKQKVYTHAWFFAEKFLVTLIVKNTDRIMELSAVFHAEFQFFEIQN